MTAVCANLKRGERAFALIRLQSARFLSRFVQDLLSRFWRLAGAVTLWCVLAFLVLRQCGVFARDRFIRKRYQNISFRYKKFRFWLCEELFSVQKCAIFFSQF